MKYTLLRWILLATLLIIFIFLSGDKPIHDFGNYYFGSYFFLGGEFNESLYDPLVFNQKVSELGFPKLWLSYSPNPPFTSLLFSPLVAFDVHTAKIIFNCISCALFLFSWMQLCNYLQVESKYMLLLPLAFVLPLYNNIAFGQVYFLLFFLMVQGFLAYQQERNVLGSLLWGTAIIFKFTPGIMVLYLLFRKKYKALAILMVVCGSLFSMSLFVNGVSVWKFFLLTILPKAGQGDATAAALTINYQSAHMFLKYLSVFDAYDNPNPLLNNHYVFLIVFFLFKIVILTLAGLCTLKASKDFNAWAIWVIAAFFISPYGNTYQYILILIPLTLLINRKWFIMIAGLCLAGLNLPIHWLYDLPLALQFPRLYFILFLFITLTSLHIRDWNWTIAAGFFVLLALVDANTFVAGKDESKYLSDTDSETLIVNYFSRNNTLAYTYWENGNERTKQLPVQVKSLLDNGVVIKQNQIFFNGKQITFSPDRKIQPRILNDTAVVYLSDKGRGYSFYKLRTLRLNR